MPSPKANVPPSTGIVSVTVGDVLPTVIVVFAAPTFPLESVTVSLATGTPRVVYVNVGLGSTESTVAVAVEVPLEADRVARIRIVRTLAGEADGQWILAVGGSGGQHGHRGRSPLTYSNRSIAASGLMAKKPSP